MATKQIKKLSDLQKITTATGDQMIPVVDASGNVNPIKLTDLAQVVAGLMPVAGVSRLGLINKILTKNELRWYKIFFCNENDFVANLLGTIQTFANQNSAVFSLYIRRYHSGDYEISVEQLTNKSIDKTYGPKIKYIIENNSITVWCYGYATFFINANCREYIECIKDEPKNEALELDLNR